MALQGTIRDFGLPDIFQLIGIQRKTGVLTLDNGDDSVTLKFHNGQVVGADTKTETLEERLGELLVRTGRITSAQLEEALRLQKNTLQRLGYILISQRHLSEEDLVEALRIQSSQIIYRLFRWREGTYHFDRVENLEYDQSHFTPISSETILMEGARMMDEWPIIERRIKSERMVLRKTDAARAVDLDDASLLEDDIDFHLGVEQPEEQAEQGSKAPLSLSPEERDVLSFVDGKRTVRAICDLVTLGEFDCQRILCDLATRQLIEEVTRERPVAEGRGEELAGRLLAGLVVAVIAAASLAGLLTLSQNPFTPWKQLAADPATDRFRFYASMTRLEKLENAVRVFYLDSGRVPPDLEALAGSGYLRPADLVDPWGRPYRLQVSAGGYRLEGLDARGEPSAVLSVSRRFNGVQNLLLDPAETTP